MKNIIWIAAALLVQQQAFAGFGQCRGRIDLVCEAQLNLINGGFRNGPSGVGRVYDHEVEYFDPVDCEASLSLNTELGKFVANYNDYNGTVRAWIDSVDGFEDLVIEDASIDTERKTSVTLPVASSAKYKSVTFTCYTQVNY